MDKQKRHTALWVVLTVLLALVLALACFLATGPDRLTPDFFRYGLYPLASVPAEGAEGLAVEMAGDGVVTDRAAPRSAGGVEYRSEVARWRIFGLGRIVEWMARNAPAVWALAALLAALCLVLWLTAPHRRIRRMQEQMKRTFTACGAKYDRADEGAEY